MKLLLLALVLLGLGSTPVAAQHHSLDLGLALLNQETADKNAVISPFSLQSAFAMTATGARGATQSEMLTSLGLGADYLESFKTDLRKFRQDGAEIAIANRLWPSQTLPLKPEFVQTCQTAFDAEPKALDFKKPEQARNTINYWISQITKANIPELIPAGVIQPTTSLVLTNALYFKGAWQTTFRTEATQSHPFQGPKGTVQVSMMQQSAVLAYFETEDIQAVQLPYAKSDIAMTIILPKKKDGWREVKRSFDPKILDNFDSQASLHAFLENQSVKLLLPRFKLRYNLSVIPAMRSLGMNLAFGAQADFSAMAPGDGFFISDAIHEAMVEVDEAGTVGAAATSIIATRSVPRMGPTMVVDHPFLFVISDTSSGATLFVGQVLLPELAKS